MWMTALVGVVLCQGPDAAALWRAGERLRAIEVRTAELAAGENDRAVRSQLVDWQIALRRYDAALGELAQLAPEDPRRGPALHGLGRYEEALAALDGANRNHALLVADCLAALGRSNEWERAIENAADLLGAEHVEVQTLRGQAHARAERYTEAIEAFRAVLTRAPQHRAAMFGLGRALVASGAREEGLHWLGEHRRLTPLLDELDFAERGLELAPLHAANWAGLGDAQRALGRTDAARASYGRAAQLARDEDVTPIALRAARLLAEDLDDLEGALALLTNARARVDDPRLSVRAADLLAAAQRFGEAREHLLHARELRPRDAAVRERLRVVEEQLDGKREP